MVGPKVSTLKRKISKGPDDEKSDLPQEVKIANEYELLVNGEIENDEDSSDGDLSESEDDENDENVQNGQTENDEDLSESEDNGEKVEFDMSNMNPENDNVNMCNSKVYGNDCSFTYPKVEYKYKDNKFVVEEFPIVQDYKNLELFKSEFMSLVESKLLEKNTEFQKPVVEEIVEDGKGDKIDKKGVTWNKWQVKEVREVIKDEYDTDSSDEEDIRNTAGNIPMRWYDDLSHVGYNWDGKQILKPTQQDRLDDFLKKMEDPNYWRSVRDPQTGQEVVLSDKDISLIKRINNSMLGDENYDDFAPTVEWFTSAVRETPLKNAELPRSAFYPCRVEFFKVLRLYRGLKSGRIKTMQQLKDEEEARLQRGYKFHLLWKNDSSFEEMRRIRDHIPAPKGLLPGHEESYNPPEEYLFNEAEMAKWQKTGKSLTNRKISIPPAKYDSLRLVPAYKNFFIDRFIRCLNLYLCPRAVRMRLRLEPEELLPKLPSRMDLQPFPTVMSIVYEGHTDMVRSISVHPSGQYLASASDDQTLKFWEVSTGRCLNTIELGGIARSVSWCPNQAMSLIAVAANQKLFIINSNLGDHFIVSKTDDLLMEESEQDKITPERIKSVVQWELPNQHGKLYKCGVRIILNHFKEIKQVNWHGRGDYFFTLMPGGDHRSILIHQLSKWRSQLPFSKPKGRVQAALFHPIKPYLIVATQHNVRIYNLVKQQMIKKLITYSKWISSIAIHPGGENLIVGTYDKKLLWFDLELSTEPYKRLSLHNQGIRGVAFHRKYPLFASTSDDQSLIVYHGMVYNDLLKNALIVPLKKFVYHKKCNDFSLFDVCFHPQQPWVFSSGADSTIRLYS